MQTHTFDPVAASDESTVVAQYFSEPHKEQDYESEAKLEAALIRQLQAQAYEYADIRGSTAGQAPPLAAHPSTEHDPRACL
ncbi:MAG: hypothetical protein PUK59_04920 [Actinomycetaceae bacterium]|nr:hypothetical protein [Actinomycetaceae bacterium]MDY5854126.1 hypothetical protein [Arcanobacterium sp.]